MKGERVGTLYVLGNGFDLSHDLPTSYDPHLKALAVSGERFSGEWESYSIEGDLWSSVEEQLAHPDVRVVLDHLDNWPPDYSSDRESDRDWIVHEAEQLLQFPLQEFAEAADEALTHARPLPKFEKLFRPDDHFVTFNYTHTLQRLYNVSPNRILHLHGEIGVSRLILGYEPGSLQGTGSLGHFDDEEGFEFYRSSAYGAVRRRLAGFEKDYQHEAMSEFLRRLPQPPDQILVIGHSLGGVDRPYFEYLARTFKNVSWTLSAYQVSELARVSGALNAYGLGLEYERRVL